MNLTQEIHPKADEGRERATADLKRSIREHRLKNTFTIDEGDQDEKEGSSA